MMIPAEIRERLARRLGGHAIEPLSPGFSGARLFRCEAAQKLVLRCWPENTSPLRVQNVHCVVAAAAAHLDLLPKYIPLDADGGSFAIDAAGLVWELATWMPGQPLSNKAPLDLIRAGGTAIGRTHLVMEPLGTSVAAAPALVERQHRIEWLRLRLPACLNAELTGRVHPHVLLPLECACRLLRSRWETAARRLEESISPWCRQPLVLQNVLRDIHREHMLFEQEKVSGIIDFDAIRVDTPAVDLARWAASFSSFFTAPAETIDCILAGYRAAETFQTDRVSNRAGLEIAAKTPLGSAQIRPLTPDFRTLIMTIAESSLWISLANWVVWLVDESRQFPDFRRVGERLSRLTESVDLWTKR